MTLKIVADQPKPAEREPDSAIESAPHDPQPAIRMPVDIRSAALTVLAVLAVVMVLQYAQGMVIPIVLGVLIS